MNSATEGNGEKVVKFVQELLLDEPERSSITPALIGEKIGLVIRMNPKWEVGLDREWVTDELIRRFSLWIGQDTTLKNDTGHVPWLSASRKKEWRYWQRYREWLERKLSFTAVDALDRSTDRVLELLEDPLRDGPWDRRGLVVGHVQSGKTGNYTGLICKAADAGYKIIVVLAGLHNNLRSQTQMRLDEGFLGYETKPNPDDMTVTGVGEIDGDPSIRPNFATNRSESGDFNTRVVQHLGISPEQRPWLFVVKKNKTVLDRLLRWIKNHVANAVDPETGRKIVTHLPLLLVDDEADHASVDTGEQVFDADGRPDEDHQPTAINRLIRRILHSFSRSAYVGYTATPFANIFIHERGETKEEGPDLFPSAFIINLAAPSNYVGPARVFGLRNGGKQTEGLPLAREVSDFAEGDGKRGWMPQGHKNGHIPLFGGQDVLPPSLVEAIDSFLIATAVRRLRGQGNQHASMLVHVTRFNSVQRAVTKQVDQHVRHLRQRLTRGIGAEDILRRLAELWEMDIVPTSREIKERAPDIEAPDLPPWQQIQDVLPDIVNDIQVRMINGTAKDALDYVDHEGTGLNVIAIGGDKLARGLTLEGLSTSYFLRASRMYDTLMQMGRWFGYRPRYLDMCRLYTTDDLVDWFRHIADAGEELREEFDLMAETGATPREYGLKVQSHPVLMVTSRVKMRSARNLLLSFSGTLLETVVLHRDKEKLQRNFEATQRLLASLGKPVEINPVRFRSGTQQRWTGYLWNSASASDVVDFLNGYQTHTKAYKVNGPLLGQFIESLASEGELTSWTVALIGGGVGDEAELTDGIRVSMLKRKQNCEHTDRYSIGRLLSPRDESIDLDEPAWIAALNETRRVWRGDPGRLQTEEPEEPNGPAIRKIRGFGAEGVEAHPERGLLLLYLLDPLQAEASFPDGTPPVVAFGISFPGTNSGRKVEYKVNNVLWEQEYGPAD
uniref:Endonuclease n=1 Tax=Geobacter metallireducens TaxID=28232 RepID=A0A831XEC5_GEOME